ncbi:MAG: FGGY-family carbohydrate kinase [Anaerolineaceae bacterium]
MTKTCLLGVDIGTYSSKGVLVDSQTGEVIASHIIEHDLSMPKPGWVEHDADKIWWDEFVHICRHLISESGVSPKEIKAVGTSGIGPCVLPVDEGGRPLRPAILYGIDTRAQAEIRLFEDALGKDAIVHLTGSSLSSSSTGPKMLWLKNHEPELYAKTRWFLTSQAYLVYRLTGRATVDVYSACSYAPFMDVENIEWLDREILGINPRSAMPEMLWTCDTAGEVSAEAARETGLAEGTPVSTGTIDAAAEAISTGLSEVGDLMMMFGSSNSLILRTDRFVRTENFWGLNWLQPQTYAVVGGMSTVGSLTRWFRDNLSPAEVAEQQKGGENAYAALTRLLEGSPLGANDLIALPYFEGERTPLYDPDACGVLFGLNLKHTRADIYRSLLESVGYGIRHNLDVMQSEGISPKRILGVGGGTKNQAWMQIIADIINTSIAIPDQQIGASYGDAFMAGVGVGIFSSLSEIKRWVHHGRVIEPSSDRHARYEPYYQIYLDLYRQTKGLMRSLADLRRKREPGN